MLSCDSYPSASVALFADESQPEKVKSSWIAYWHRRSGKATGVTRRSSNGFEVVWANGSKRYPVVWEARRHDKPPTCAKKLTSIRAVEDGHDSTRSLSGRGLADNERLKPGIPTAQYVRSPAAPAAAILNLTAMADLAEVAASGVCLGKSALGHCRPSHVCSTDATIDLGDFVLFAAEPASGGAPRVPRGPQVPIRPIKRCLTPG